MFQPSSLKLCRAKSSAGYEARLTPHETILPPSPRLRRTSRHMKRSLPPSPKAMAGQGRLHFFAQGQKMVGVLAVVRKPSLPSKISVLSQIVECLLLFENRLKMAVKDDRDFFEASIRSEKFQQPENGAFLAREWRPDAIIQELRCKSPTNSNWSSGQHGLHAARGRGYKKRLLRAVALDLSQKSLPLHRAFSREDRRTILRLKNSFCTWGNSMGMSPIL